jgi:hypothetical protein
MKTTTLLILLLFSTSVTFAQIKSDYDKDADFSKYNTYSFAGWAENSDQSINDIDKKRILSALKSEMDERGLELVESGGDAQFTLFVVIDQKTSTTAYTNYTGGMGYGGGWGWGYGGMGSATTTYSEQDYNEGTLVVDMYDTDEKNLVWQGVITSVVKTKPEKREKNINKKIGKLMKKFPISASS